MKKLWMYFVLLFIFLFDLWIANSTVASAFYGRWVKPYTDDAKFSVLWTILLVIAFVIYHRQVVDKNEFEKRELKDITHSRMEMLVMANQELSSYRERDILISLFKRFVALNPYVIGVQLYEYSQHHINGKSLIKLSLLDGYVRENIDVNAAQQAYYSFNIGMYREFRDAYDRLFIPNSTEDAQDDLSSANTLIRFIQKYNQKLSQKPIQSFTVEDTMEYAFVNAGTRLLEAAGVGGPIGYFLDPDKKVALEALKRTGYMEAVLVGIPITFSHKRKNEKADRQYIASPMDINGRQYVYIILLDPEILNDVNKEETLDNLTDDFELKLVNCFESIYNRDIREG